MVITGILVTSGVSSLYISLRTRKKPRLVNLLDSNPAHSSAKQQALQQISAFYRQAHHQVGHAKAHIATLTDVEAWLAPTHRHATKPLYQLISPWADQAHKIADSVQAIPHDKAQATTGIVRTQLRLYMRYLVYYWRPYWKWGIAAIIFCSTFNIYLVVYSAKLKVILDSLALLPFATILGTLLKLSAALPIAFAFTLLGEYLSSRLASRLAKDMRYDVVEHIQSLPMDYYKQHPLGDTLSLLSADMTKLQEGLGDQLIQLASCSFAIAMYIVAMFWMAWPLALFVLVSLPVTTSILQRVSPDVGLLNRQLRQREAMTLNATQEVLRAQPIVKSFGIYQFIQDAYVDELKKLESTNTTAKFALLASIYFSFFLITLVENSVLGFGILLAFFGMVPVSTLVAFQIIMMSLRREYSFATFSANNVMESAACIERLHQLFQVQSEMSDSENAHELTTIRQAVRFENVTFSYTGTGRQLHDLNLTIEPGQYVAIVGPSGAGKSTIINLLMRFYDIADGAITFDGHDVRTVTRASLRSRFGVVLQETFLFNTNFLNNIRVVRPQATNEDVIAAAKAAELHDFIMTLPDGYECNVGEGGGKLSGGQKQRVAIARAMLCNADILLLDEATSSLDAETAAAIHSTIQRIAQDRTVISITHALSSVVHADKIYVLDKGRLAQEGTHQSLLAAGGLYAQLWSTQNNGSPIPAMNGVFGNTWS